MRSRSLLLAALLMFVAGVAKAQRQGPGVFTHVDSGSDRWLYPESRADGERGQKADAEMAKKYYKHGVEYGRSGLFPQAAAAFEIAVSLNPWFGDAYYGLGHAYFDLHRWHDAEQALRQVLRLKPRDREARMMLDEISTRLRQQQDAAVLVRSTVKQSDNHASQIAQKNIRDLPTKREVSEVPPAVKPTRPPLQPVQLGDSRSSHPINVSTKPSVKDIQQQTVAKGRGAITENVSDTSLKASESKYKSLPLTLGSKASQQASIARDVPLAASDKRVLQANPGTQYGSPSGDKTVSGSALPVAFRNASANSDTQLSGVRQPASGNSPVVNESAVSASKPLKSKPVDNSAAPNKLFSEDLKTKTAPMSTEPAATVAPARDLTKIYHVGAGDVLDIRLADQRTDHSTLFTVTAGGLLDYPVLDKSLTVDGLSTDEIAAQLKTELKRRALSEADVSVAVRDYSSHTVIISGLVKDPGTKIIRREAIPLYVVLADAQVNPEATRAGVIAYGSGESKTVDLLDPKATGLLIRPGDVITVRASPKEFFYVGGDVKLPGEKTFHAGLTLTQAILAAGGTTRKAKEVEVGRDSGNGILTFTRFRLAEIKASQIVDPLVQPGDRITVME